MNAFASGADEVRSDFVAAELADGSPIRLKRGVVWGYQANGAGTRVLMSGLQPVDVATPFADFDEAMNRKDDSGEDRLEMIRRGLADRKPQRQMAKELGISQGRVSQLVKQIKREPQPKGTVPQVEAGPKEWWQKPPPNPFAVKILREAAAGRLTAEGIKEMADEAKAAGYGIWPINLSEGWRSSLLLEPDGSGGFLILERGLRALESWENFLANQDQSGGPASAK